MLLLHHTPLEVLSFRKGGYFLDFISPEAEENGGEKGKLLFLLGGGTLWVFLFGIGTCQLLLVEFRSRRMSTYL